MSDGLRQGVTPLPWVLRELETESSSDRGMPDSGSAYEPASLNYFGFTYRSADNSCQSPLGPLRRWSSQEVNRSSPSLQTDQGEQEPVAKGSLSVLPPVSLDEGRTTQGSGQRSRRPCRLHSYGSHRIGDALARLHTSFPERRATRQRNQRSCIISSAKRTQLYY